jgi:type VI secretion system secreted protein VgrG
MGALELSFESGDGSLSVRRFAVHEGLSSPFSISIWARSPNDDLDFEEFVGKKAALRVDGGAASRVWAGIVSTMELVQVESTGLSTYYLRIVPLAWVLTQRRNHRLFQHQSAVEIAKTLLDEWSIEPELRLDEAAFPKLEIRCQYGESDYAFLCRILEEAGITFFFTAPEGEGDSTLVLSDAPQSAEARPPLRFFDEPNAASGLFATQVRIARDVRPGKVTIRDHDPRRKPNFELEAQASAKTGGIEDQLEIHAFSPGAFVVEMNEEDAKKQDEKTGVAAFMKELPAKLAGGAASKLVKSKLSGASGGMVGDLGGDIAADSAGAMAQKIASLIAAPAPNKNANRLAGDDKGFARYDEQVGKARAQRALDSIRATRYAVHFSTNAVDVAPGAVLSLAGHPKQALAADKRLLVTEVLLEGSPEGEWDVAVSALFADRPYRPPLVTPKPTMSGSQTALVVGPEGEEIHTDEFGRVRVRFHWDRGSPKDDGSSCWLRVAQGWSGPGYGFVTLPRVGQEVLVGFLEGDPDQPVVVGTMFNNTSRIAHQLPGHKTRSSWKSSSSPGGEGGNEILFEDAAGKELVYLHAQKSLQEVVRADRGALVGKTASTLAGEKHLITVGEGVTLHEMVEQKITFTTGQASITLDGPDILIEAQGKIIVKSDGDDVVLKGGPMVKINSSATASFVEAKMVAGDPAKGYRELSSGEIARARDQAACMAECTSKALRDEKHPRHAEARSALLDYFASSSYDDVANSLSKMASTLRDLKVPKGFQGRKCGHFINDTDLVLRTEAETKSQQASNLGLAAWVYRSDPQKRVHLGPAWPADPKQQAETVLHEVAHLHGHVDDYKTAGGPPPGDDGQGRQLQSPAGADGDVYGDSEVRATARADPDGSTSRSLAEPYALFASKVCAGDCE